MSFVRVPTGRALLSDHMPFLVKSNDLQLLGWNMLCQMQFNKQWKYFNNGFECSQETPDEYRNRLSHVAGQLGIAVKQAKLSFICLQECPETQELRDVFITELKHQDNLKNLGIEYYNNDADEYYLITLYDASNYTLDAALTEQIKAVSLNEGLNTRILPLVFLNNATKETVLVVNVHGNFGKEIKKDLQALFDATKKLNIMQMVLLGDFNRDLVLQSDSYSKHDISTSLDDNGRFADSLYVKAVAGSSFISKYNSEKDQTNTVLETRDGSISTFPITVESLTEINKQNIALESSKKLSQRLSVFPKEVLASANKEEKISEFSKKFSS